MATDTVARKLSFSASRRSTRGWKTALIFAAPALLLFTLFVVLPVFEAGMASVYNWNGLGPPKPEKFVGRAPQQVDEFLRETVEPIRKRYANALTHDAHVSV